MRLSQAYGDSIVNSRINQEKKPCKNTIAAFLSVVAWSPLLLFIYNYKTCLFCPIEGSIRRVNRPIQIFTILFSKIWNNGIILSCFYAFLTQDYVLNNLNLTLI